MGPRYHFILPFVPLPTPRRPLRCTALHHSNTHPRSRAPHIVAKAAVDQREVAPVINCIVFSTASFVAPASPTAPFFVLSPHMAILNCSCMASSIFHHPPQYVRCFLLHHEGLLHPAARCSASSPRATSPTSFPPCPFRCWCAQVEVRFSRSLSGPHLSHLVFPTPRRLPFHLLPWSFSSCFSPSSSFVNLFRTSPVSS